MCQYLCKAWGKNNQESFHVVNACATVGVGASRLKPCICSYYLQSRILLIVTSGEGKAACQQRSRHTFRGRAPVTDRGRGELSTNTQCFVSIYGTISIFANRQSWWNQHTPGETEVPWRRPRQLKPRRAETQAHDVRVIVERLHRQSAADYGRLGVLGSSH